MCRRNNDQIAEVLRGADELADDGADNRAFADCLAYPLAIGDATLAGRALIEQVLAQASFDLDPRLVSDSVETMKAFVRMNRGVCF